MAVSIQEHNDTQGRMLKKNETKNSSTCCNTTYITLWFEGELCRIWWLGYIMISSIRTVTKDMRAVVDNHHAHGSYVLKRCTRPVYAPSALCVHWYTLNFGLDP